MSESDIDDIWYLYIGIFFIACAAIALLALAVRSHLRGIPIGQMAQWVAILLALRLGWLFARIEKKQQDPDQRT
ncbi:hypothetical protein SAMN06269185_1076 [Natronoarchaeum philippinense]|uniref:Uncharacterized protein n=1 Tax=Natronoarchaeum philippinense TaxID=558529 RepID=A0A285N9S3_NATPI|nr:hypothetical protein [Natronoarchaeum philippinense]SNZ06180.1 hypothetical protein SAMN06269185_1076 [Natronoarchaeum philippinense]